MIGIAIKKENCVDLFKLNPLKHPIQIVIPDLEIPGSIANACAIPINNAIFNVKLLSVLLFEIFLIEKSTTVIIK